MWRRERPSETAEECPVELDPTDPLAPFRARGAKAQAPAIIPQKGYRAFATAASGAKPARLDIRPKTGMAVARLYSAITEIAYDRGEYTGILLVLPGKLIKVRGRGLKPVVDALIAGTCEYITELPDAERPQDGAPVIERIEVLTPQAK